jgi:hypothetical protein
MINEIAYEAQDRYAQLVKGWRDIFLAELLGGDFSSASARRNLAKSAWVFAYGAYQENERELVRKLLSTITENAQGEMKAFLSDEQQLTLRSALTEHLKASVAYLRIELETLVRLDIITLKQRYMERVIDIERRASLRAITKRQALIEVELSRPQIGRRDSAGRLFSSDIVARNAWRLAMIGIRNEVVLQAATILGHRSVAILKQEPTGVKTLGFVSLDGLNTGMDYDEARKQFFHPNSNAYLEIDHVLA